MGFGKAVGGMVKALMDTVGHANVIEGIISVPTGSCYHLQHDLSPVRLGQYTLIEQSCKQHQCL